MGVGEERQAPLGVGVVGYGYWGPKLARNFSDNEHTAVRAVADPSEERLSAMTRRGPQARLTTHHEDLLRDEAIDAVAIATPVSSHFELARAALEAGKHVLVAKPLCATVAEADALVDLARDVDRVLMVDHTFVYAGAVQAIRRLIRDGTLGELYYFDSVRVNLGTVQRDVNVIWDLAAHDFAILTHLFEAEPVSISAVGTSHSASGLEDIAYVTVRFPDDLIAHFHLSWISPVKIRQTLIGGSERMLVWDDLASDQKVKVFETAGGVFGGNGRDEGSAVAHRSDGSWAAELEGHEPLASEIEHFAECIRTARSPLTDAESGRQVVRLLEATSASLEAGGEVMLLAELAKD